MSLRLGDDIGTLLKPEHRAEFDQWCSTTGRRVTYAAWQDPWHDCDRLIAVYVESPGSHRKLLLKYAPDERSEPVPIARDFQALADAPADFAERHLLRQPIDPFMVGERGWILFQEIPGGDLTRIASMADRLQTAAARHLPLTDIAAAANAVMSAVIGAWNAESVRWSSVPVKDQLRTLLDTGLTLGHPVRTWARSAGLLDGSPDPLPTDTDVDGLPNPFRLLSDARGGYVPAGRAHGDLHPGNILLGDAPGQFWLIDLSRYSAARNLTCDPAALLVAITAQLLPGSDERVRAAAIEALVGFGETATPWLPPPVQELIRTIHVAAAATAAEAGMIQEWRGAFLIAVVACALTWCGRSADRGWFLRLAAEAAQRQGETMTGEPAQQVETRATTGRPQQSYLDSKIAGFVGRTAALAEIESFLDGNPSGYVVVEGLPGIGKTSLLAKVADERDCPAHFNIDGDNITSTAAFLDSMHAQLTGRFGLTIAPPQEQDVHNGTYFSELLTRSARRLDGNDRLVIVVDALDEVTPGRPGANPLFLPRVLPAGVFLLVSRRHETAALGIQTHHHYVDMMRDATGNRTDARAFIERSLDARHMRTRLAGVDRGRLADELLDRSEANFMYLMYMLGAIRTGLAAPGDLRTAPKGLREYYAWHWGRMVASGATTVAGLVTAAVLANLSGPVTSTLLATITREPEIDVVRTLDAWGQFITKNKAGKRNQYQIYHKDFRDFLRDRDEIRAMGVEPIAGAELARRLAAGLDLPDE